MKRLLVLLFLATALVSGLTGCEKVTGGGWFYNEGDPTQKVTFGFNAHPGDPIADDPGWSRAKGQFQLNDHANKRKIHGEFSQTWGEMFDDAGYSGASMFFGTCSVNGKEGQPLVIMVADQASATGLYPAKSVMIMVGPEGTSDYYVYSGVLGGGNIEVHEEE